MLVTNAKQWLRMGALERGEEVVVVALQNANDTTSMQRYHLQRHIYYSESSTVVATSEEGRTASQTYIYRTCMPYNHPVPSGWRQQNVFPEILPPISTNEFNTPGLLLLRPLLSASLLSRPCRILHERKTGVQRHRV